MSVLTLTPKLKILSEHTLLRSDAEKGSAGAEIFLSPDKKNLYISNRNIPSKESDTIAIFPVSADGSVSKTAKTTWVESGGKHPRGWGWSSDLCIGDKSKSDSCAALKASKIGDYVAVANQDTGSLVMFKRNAKSGSLSEVTRLDVGKEYKATTVVWF
jgi:6-phosphogluconolactonase (cycloisomerase 2 family)